MKPKALEEAHARIDRARAALATMQVTTQETPFAEFETAWANFLVAASGVYSKLEQGAKGNSKSEPWFGKIKHIRKKDPLLSYLHHARNSEEHGLSRSDQRDVLVESINDRVEVRYSDDPDAPTEIIWDNSKGPLQPDEPLVRFVRLGIRLVNVIDSKHGDRFLVPREHLGHRMPNSSPITIAQLAITYLEGLVAEAAAL